MDDSIGSPHNIIKTDYSTDDHSPIFIKSPHGNLVASTYEITSSYEYSVELPYDEYAKYFADIDHSIYAVVSSELNSKNNKKLIPIICAISVQIGHIFHPNYNKSVIIPHGKNITKYINNLFKNNKSIKLLRLTPSLVNDLILHEKMHTFAPGIINIGIIYGNHMQSDPLDMLTNKIRDVSPNFIKFIDGMEIPEYDPDYIYNDIYNSLKIRYYLAASMDSEDIRQMVGNSQCIIIFKDNKSPLDMSLINKLGKVNRFFFIVESISISGRFRYRVGFCQRVDNDLEQVPPVIPSNVTFDIESLKTLMLTKFSNLIMQYKSSHIYSYPRAVSLNNIIAKYS